MGDDETTAPEGGTGRMRRALRDCTSRLERTEAQLELAHLQLEDTRREVRVLGQHYRRLWWWIMVIGSIELILRTCQLFKLF